jgi:phosphatidyl-myo-inositol alpha-mannosyltransferase
LDPMPETQTGIPYGDGPTIAFLGRLNEPRKGLSVLVQAIPKVLAKHPNAKFIIAGEGESGKTTTAQTLGPLINKVTFLGSITENEKINLLQTSDIFVAPQIGGESFGIVLIEAMAAGTTVVASDLSAFRHVLADGAAGKLFPVGDGGALAQAINHLIESPAQRQKYQSFAAEWVKQFDWEIVTEQILKVYESVLNPPSSLVVP